MRKGHLRELRWVSNMFLTDHVLDNRVTDFRPGPEQVKLVIGVINETLRMYPPAPEPTQRTNGPTPTTINGKYIPPNTNVRPTKNHFTSICS